MPRFSKPVHPHNWKCFRHLFLCFVALAKLGGININNLRYADDSTLMAESIELKSLLMKVREEGGKSWLKT